MEIIKKFFYIFLIISLIFLFAGVFSGYTLANIERSRDLLISSNPVDVKLTYEYNKSSYVLILKFGVNNSGLFDYWIEKITWTCYLVNNTNGKLYQANNYQRYYPEKIRVERGKILEIEIVDNVTTHQWENTVFGHLMWQINNYGVENITWKNSISIDGWLDSFSHKEYRYNQRTWYLWKLSEVLIEYDESIS